MEEKAKKNGKKNKILSIVILILALVYGVSPVDIIPDMPVVGWADDFFIIAFAVLNMLQFSSDDNHPGLSRFAKWAKWLVALFGIAVIVWLLLIGTAVVKLLS